MKKSRGLLTLAALVGGIASAQTTGTIVGSVTDATTGKPVAGAAVVATSPRLPREQTAATDGSGAFRFDLLPSGPYRLVVKAFTGSTPGGEPVEYGEAQRSDIAVRVDTTLRVNLALVPSSVQLDEQVVRTGAAPVVDVGSAETGAVLTKDFLAGVPLPRDFAGGAIVAPGAQGDLYGTSFGGATSPENGYFLDGMNVTDPAFGTQGSHLLTNFVEEVNVKSGSFMPEYGRATGGIVNVVTKSGSNEFHGSLFGNITPGALSPPANAVGRAAEAIATRPAQSKEYQTDFGFDLGGPIVKDRLWFYVGFAPVINHFVDERYYQVLSEDPQRPGQALRDPSTGLPQVTRLGPSQLFPGCRPAGGSLPCTQFSGTQYQVASKLGLLLDENNDLGLSLYAAPQTREFLSTGNATTSAGLFDDRASSTDLIGRYTGKFIEKHLLVEAQGGWHHQALSNGTGVIDVNGAPVDQRAESAVRWDLTHNLTDFYDEAALGSQLFAACDPSTHSSFNPCPVTRFLTGGRGFITDDKLDRVSGKLSASALFQLHGQHILKGGLDVERSSYDRAKVYSGGVFLREHDNGAFGATFQDAADFAVLPLPTSTAADAVQYQALKVKSISLSRALFLQDSWTIGDALTLNFGVRWEMQDMLKAGAANANLAIHDNIAPRVQAIYDFTGQGRGAIKASWGRFYENIPLDLGDRSFGGETQVVSERERCVSASPRVGGSPASCDRIAGANSDGSTYGVVNAGTVPVAPDLKGQYVDMFGGSIEYEFLPDFSAAFEYQGRRLGRVIEDMSVDEGGTFFIANPGESKPFRDANGILQDPRVATALDPVTLRPVAIAEPRPDRRYDGFTFALRKRFSRKWLMEASYTYSILRGNYPGLFEENGQLDPNVLPEYDLVSLLPNRYGPLPNDMPHQFKLFASYLFELTSRLRLRAGTALRARSGTPVSYLGAHPTFGEGEAFILPRGSAGRTPWVTSVDLRGALEYALTPRYLLRFTLDVFNVLNQQQAVAVDQNYTFDNVQPIVNGQCNSRNAASSSAPLGAALADCPDLRYLRTRDGRAVTVNQNFGRPTQYQAPLAVRFGLALLF